VKAAPGPGDERAAALRRAFDEAFASPAGGARAEVEDFLAIRVAGEAYAFRLAGIAGLYADRPIVPLPEAASELLGIAGLRGSLVAVYDLRALLGAPRGETPRWIALAASERTVGLAFDELEGFLHLAPADLTAPGNTPGRHVQAVASAGGTLRSIVDVAAVVETIRGLARRDGPPRGAMNDGS
jgi:purine-binding chemotaxis protein CheW